MRAKNPTLVAVPKTSPVPKIAATEKTLSLNKIPLEKNKNNVMIKAFPIKDFTAK